MTKTVADLYLTVLEEMVGRVSEALKELYLACWFEFSEIADDFFTLFDKYSTLGIEKFEEMLYLHAMHKCN